MSMCLDVVHGCTRKPAERFPGVTIRTLTQKAGPMQSASAQEAMVSVMLKISDLEIWEKLEGVTTGSVIPNGVKRWIVAAEIPVSCIESIQQEPWVVNMEISERSGASEEKVIPQRMPRGVLISIRPILNFDKQPIDEATSYIYTTLLPACERKGVRLSSYGNHAGSGSLKSVLTYDQKKEEKQLFDVARIQLAFAGLKSKLKTCVQYQTSSYYLKQKVEEMPGQPHIANGELIAAMLLMGYQARFGKRSECMAVNCMFKAKIK